MQGAAEQTNCLQGVKKPSSSVSRIYLKQAIRHYLYKADAIADEKESFSKLEIVRELTNRLRKQAGFSWWVPLCFAVSVCVLFVLWLAARTSKTYYYTYPTNYLRVVENLDPCVADGSCGKRFVVQSVVNGVAGPETEMHFRTDQHFEAGHTFSWIRYKVIGGEVVTDGWDILRDANHNPVVAPNCEPDYSIAPAAGHFRCEGGKARF